MPRLTTLATAAVAFVLTACSTPPAARLHHVVLFKLDDPGAAGALIHDSRAMLAEIPGVVSMSAGPPAGIDLPIVDDDFDVALVVGFATKADYLAYVDHPAHEATSRAWRPRLEWVRVHDVVTE
ncbi:MAG: Dabb family protein [Planctomycetes bacterium]|nr:Dabb family protein [Planctomycetota bacterium]